MLYAKSIYHGGDIITPELCDYESYKQLGLTCPFCNNAVFLRRATQRILKEKPINIAPHFCHFKVNDIEDDSSDCEARSLTKEGKEEIERVRTESRNQRLKIYNHRLWSIFVESVPGVKSVPPREFEIKRGHLYTKKATKQFALKIQTEIAESFITDLINNFVKNRIEMPETEYLTLRSTTLTQKFRTDEKVIADFHHNKNYFDKCKPARHLSICKEVIAFLQTKSGLFCLGKLLKYSLFAVYILAQSGNITVDDESEFGSALLNFFVATIAGVFWEEVLK